MNVSTTAAGRKTYSHSGAFGMGAAAAFKVVPSTGVALVALTNGYPIGVPKSSRRSSSTLSNSAPSSAITWRW